MVKIKFFKYLQTLHSHRFLLFAVLLLLFSEALHSQVQKEPAMIRRAIDLRNADDDFIEKDSTGKDMHRLLGNVLFFHNNITLSCDSAHYFPEIKQIFAYKKVHIEQGDTLDLFSDYLFYDGKTELSIAKGNVELIDKETHLFTDTINYDVRNRVARYEDKGRITNADNTLTSIIGIYYVSESLFHFKDSVKIVNPDYVMTADTMDYNTNTEIAFFTGPTELNGDSIYLYCEKGWYDTRNDKTNIWKHAMIDNKKQIIHGDSLFFDNISGFGQSFGNVIIQDTTNNLIVQGEYAWYYKEPERFLVTDSAMFIQVSNKDSLFLHADTITSVSVADTALSLEYRLMKAYHGCRIFSKDLQAKCDSLSYSFQDSVIRLYREPVLWSEENQLTSDSMAVFTKNRKTDRLELYSSAFIASQIDTIRFNQIKGRALTGYFRNNELFKIEIKGNGESIYYLLDGEEVAGVDQSKCVNIEVYLVDGKISEIYEKQDPDGTIDPPDPFKPKELRLKGFNWFSDLRPKDKLDIFRKQKKAEPVKVSPKV
jgi:lipopolysaccharide export system protein LptA